MVELAKNIMKIKFNRFQWIAHFGSLIPFLLLLLDAFTNNLTVNPIQEITQRTGRSAIIWLLLSLSCTPINIILGLKPFLQLRRPLGLYAAFYSFLHFLTFSVLDYNLNFELISQTIPEKPYIILGSIGFLILFALTITSTKKSMKKLGKKWNLLHKLVYPAAIILLIHNMLAQKFIDTFAIAIIIITFILLFIRLPFIRSFFIKHQPGWSSKVNQNLTGRKPSVKINTSKENL